MDYVHDARVCSPHRCTRCRACWHATYRKHARPALRSTRRSPRSLLSSSAQGLGGRAVLQGARLGLGLPRWARSATTGSTWPGPRSLTGHRSYRDRGAYRRHPRELLRERPTPGARPARADLDLRRG
ncbi:hypothetical protein HBB16_19095 [Pseudonocardia sp. MCCB 268]|nr:hypothetical protein [Pseudonocardia cytotoxica]